MPHRFAAHCGLRRRPRRMRSASHTKPSKLPEPAAAHAVSARHGKLRGRAAPLEFRRSDQMTEQDRDLAGGRGVRHRRARRVCRPGIQSGQVELPADVCPALPNHLFLQFTRNNGTGDVSVFSASIPRGGDGRVRIIPILRARLLALLARAHQRADHLGLQPHPRRRASPDTGRPTGWAPACAMPHWPERIPQAVGHDADSEQRSFPAARRGDDDESRCTAAPSSNLPMCGDSTAHAVDYDLQRQRQTAEGHAFRAQCRTIQRQVQGRLAPTAGRRFRRRCRDGATEFVNDSTVCALAVASCNRREQLPLITAH